MKIIDNKGFFESKDVYVYPCAYRSDEYTGSSRLNTEENITKLNGSVSDIKDCYYNEFTGKHLTCVLHGYKFIINTTKDELDNLFTSGARYLRLQLGDKKWSETETTKIIISQNINIAKEVSASITDLDQEIDGITYFTGLSVVNTKPNITETDCYYLLLITEKAEVNAASEVPTVATSLEIKDATDKLTPAQFDVTFYKGTTHSTKLTKVPEAFVSDEVFNTGIKFNPQELTAQGTINLGNVDSDKDTEVVNINADTNITLKTDQAFNINGGAGSGLSFANSQMNIAANTTISNGTLTITDDLKNSTTLSSAEISSNKISANEASIGGIIFDNEPKLESHMSGLFIEGDETTGNYYFATFADGSTDYIKLRTDKLDFTDSISLIPIGSESALASLKINENIEHQLKSELSVDKGIFTDSIDLIPAGSSYSTATFTADNGTSKSELIVDKGTFTEAISFKDSSATFTANNGGGKSELIAQSINTSPDIGCGLKINDEGLIYYNSDDPADTILLNRHEAEGASGDMVTYIETTDLTARGDLTSFSTITTNLDTTKLNFIESTAESSNINLKVKTPKSGLKTLPIASVSAKADYSDTKIQIKGETVFKNMVTFDNKDLAYDAETTSFNGHTGFHGTIHSYKPMIGQLGFMYDQEINPDDPSQDFYALNLFEKDIFKDSIKIPNNYWAKYKALFGDIQPNMNKLSLAIITIVYKIKDGGSTIHNGAHSFIATRGAEVVEYFWAGTEAGTDKKLCLHIGNSGDGSSWAKLTFDRGDSSHEPITDPASHVTMAYLYIVPLTSYSSYSNR